MKIKIKPIKKLGQNFLIDKNAVKKIIKAADLKPQDIVLEIGPGLGVLTRELAKKAKKVIAIEKDPRMCQALKENLKDFDNIEIINQDILKIPNSQLPIPNKMSNAQCQNSKNSKIRHLRIRNFVGNWKLEIGNYKIVANLPFYITAPVIRKFLESENPPQEMVLTIQKEVAQRICPRPPKPEGQRRGKTPRMNLLAISVQFYARAEIISYVSKKSFCPKPKVDAAIIKLKPFNQAKKFAWAHSHFASPKRASAFRMRFFRIVRAGFSQPRKQLINNLSKGLKIDKQKLAVLLAEINIKSTQRAETLSINNWLDLSKVL